MQPTASPAFPLTVFHDASCPLCAEEMAALRRHLPAAELVLVDCSDAAFDPADWGPACPPRAALLARLHARDAAGRWFSGPVVFAALYDRAGLPRIARLWRGPVLGRAAALAYPLIARARPLLRHVGGRWLMHRLLAWAERDPRAAACRSCANAVAADDVAGRGREPAASSADPHAAQ